MLGKWINYDVLKFSMSWLLRMRYVLMGCQQVTIYVYNLLLNTIMLLQSVASHQLENTILLLKVNHQRVVRQLGTEVHIQRSKKSLVLYNSKRSGDVTPLPSRKKNKEVSSQLLSSSPTPSPHASPFYPPTPLLIQE